MVAEERIFGYRAVAPFGRQLAHAANASFVQKARDPTHAEELLSYAVARVAPFDEPGPEALNHRAKNGQRRIPDMNSPIQLEQHRASESVGRAAGPDVSN